MGLCRQWFYNIIPIKAQSERRIKILTVNGRTHYVRHTHIRYCSMNFIQTRILDPQYNFNEMNSIFPSYYMRRMKQREYKNTEQSMSHIYPYEASLNMWHYLLTKFKSNHALISRTILRLADNFSSHPFFWVHHPLIIWKFPKQDGK